MWTKISEVLAEEIREINNYWLVVKIWLKVVTRLSPVRT